MHWARGAETFAHWPFQRQRSYSWPHTSWLSPYNLVVMSCVNMSVHSDSRWSHDHGGSLSDISEDDGGINESCDRKALAMASVDGSEHVGLLLRYCWNVVNFFLSAASLEKKKFYSCVMHISSCVNIGMSSASEVVWPHRLLPPGSAGEGQTAQHGREREEGRQADGSPVP